MYVFSFHRPYCRRLAFFISLLMYLTAPGLSCIMLDRQLQDVNSYLWLVGFYSGTKDGNPGPPALGVQSLSHWTIREVP